MSEPRVSIIVAMDEKRGIGKRNEIPWYVPGEQKRFKEITMGHPIIMGKNTHESIGRALPGRTNIVLAKERDYEAPGCVVVHSLEDAINRAKEEDNEEIFIVGGGEVYRQTLPLADRLYVTLIEGDYGADIFFPEYQDKFRKVVKEEQHEVGGYKYKFMVLER